MMEMKTFAWAEIVFGIMDLGLGIILYLTETYFKREVSILLIVGGWGIFGGLCLLCLGGKPSYSCVKVNTLLQLATFVASCAGFATLARHVPYKESDMSRDAEVLVNRVLAFFIAVLVLQALMNLVVMVMGVCSMFDPSPESADPERIGSTTTTEQLCPPPTTTTTTTGDGCG